MKLVETKSYEFKIENEEKTQFWDTIELLRDIAREIESTVGADFCVDIEDDTYVCEDLWRAATFLEGLVCNYYRI